MTECSEMACREPQGMVCDEKCSKSPKEQNLYRAFAALRGLGWLSAALGSP